MNNFIKKLLGLLKKEERKVEPYKFQFSEKEARRAQEYGFLQQVDSETRELVAVGCVRVYERLVKEIVHAFEKHEYKGYEKEEKFMDPAEIDEELLKQLNEYEDDEDQGIRG